MNWTKDGKRNNLPMNKCKKAHTVRETDGKIYCYGYKDESTDEPISNCMICKFFTRNMD